MLRATGSFTCTWSVLLPLCFRSELFQQMWLVGQHLSTAHDQRCTPHQVTSLYELLEALCYELLGLQRSVVLSEGATCSARFISVLLLTLAKVSDEN